jgi:hypothetical protein
MKFMKYIRVAIHLVVECILHPFENVELYFDESGNLINRVKY